MNRDKLTAELFEGLRGLPIIDVHTHLTVGHLGARGLHDILLYHMVISDLYSAGCPSGNRLTEVPETPSAEEARRRIEEALPFLPHIGNTSSYWGVRIILRVLFGWDEAITFDNWRRLDALIRERSTDRSWHREILKRAGIRRIGTELSRRGRGEDDDIFHYTLEWAFFTRCQWGEFDTALWELERCLGQGPGVAAPIASGERSRTERTIRTVDDVDEAVAHYVGAIPFDRIIATATHFSTDIDYTPVTRAQMSQALARREQAGERERSIYAAYVNGVFLTALEARGQEIVFQFSLGAEPLPYETGSRLSQRTIQQLGEMIARHPGLRFQCFLACQHAHQALCTLSRELPNFSLAGYWWHNFFPGTIRSVMEERLDMLPSNRQIGFFSDAYCAEWAYTKAVIVRRQLAEVLARKVAQGQYSMDDAMGVAEAILFESPQTLLGMTPSPALEPPEGGPA